MGNGEQVILKLHFLKLFIVAILILQLNQLNNILAVQLILLEKEPPKFQEMAI